MPKVKRIFDGENKTYGIIFWCPGCQSSHQVTTKDSESRFITVAWDFNGDLEKPTINPSILVYGHPSGSPEFGIKHTPRCHSFVRDGRIEFCGDSEHELKGQTVDLPDVDTVNLSD